LTGILPSPSPFIAVVWRFARRVSSIALRASGDYRPPRSLSMADSV
jgi:hypothetical protein